MPYFKKRFRKKYTNGFRSKRKRSRMMKKPYKTFRKYKPTGLFRKKTINRMLNVVAEKKRSTYSGTMTCRAITDATNSPWLAIISTCWPSGGYSESTLVGRKIHILYICVHVTFTLSSSQNGISPIRVVVVKAKDVPPVADTYFRFSSTVFYTTSAANIKEAPVYKSVLLATNRPNYNFGTTVLNYSQRKFYIPVNKDYQKDSNGDFSHADYHMGAIVPGTTTSWFTTADPTISYQFEMVYTDI